MTETLDNKKNEPSRCDVSPSVREMIYSLPIPENVKAKVQELYSYIKDNKNRREQRSKYLCFCVRQAYLEVGDMFPPDPVVIGEMLGIKPASVSAAISKRPPFPSTLQLKSSVIPLHEMVRHHARVTLGLSNERVETMVKDFNLLLDWDSNLKKDQSKPLVAAYIYCYAISNAWKIDMMSLARAFHLEESTISTRCPKIEKSYIEMLGSL